MGFQTKLALNIAQLGPIGRARFAPGTAGSLFALLLAPLCFLPFSLPIRIVILLILFALGVWASKLSTQELGEDDPGSIIIDELVGQWIALLPLVNISYFGTEAIQLYQGILLIFAFMLFRIFDITKLGPVGLCERKISGAVGIMADDVMAGVLAMVLVSPIQFYADLLWSV